MVGFSRIAVVLDGGSAAVLQHLPDDVVKVTGYSRKRVLFAPVHL